MVDADKLKQLEVAGGSRDRSTGRSLLMRNVFWADLT